MVVGYGYAGAVAALEAQDAGADVLLIEKMPDPGGISITSGGNVRTVADAEEGLRHLRASNGGTTPDSVLKALAAGMKADAGLFRKALQGKRRHVDRRQADGNYPFSGHADLRIRQHQARARISIRDGPIRSYRAMSPSIGRRACVCSRSLRTISASRNVRVMLSTSAKRLIWGTAGRSAALQASATARINIKARRAVVLACGGFEASPELQMQYWQEKPVLNAAYMGNTGDGIRMAQDVGAALWHMWHYHGVYGFKHPDPNYPFGIRPKRLPDWIPGEAARADVKVPWIIVDRRGRRFMNEYQPYTQDTSWRAMAAFDSACDELFAHSFLHDHGRARARRLSDRFADIQ